jgi:hypothetical protein
MCAAALMGCVSEEVAAPPAPNVNLFDLPSGVLPAGTYHGVSFFFEIDLRVDPEDPRKLVSDDLPELARWAESEREKGQRFFRQLPPIVPDLLPGGREVYRVSDIHRVDYVNSMFEVGGYRFLRMPKARLYVFKRRSGPFSFEFRGQKIVIPDNVEWVPSIYYCSQEAAEGGRLLLVREFVQVGLATIESLPQDGYWLVNGRKYFPGSGRPLELYDALHSLGTR